ncbi:hypothetical protein [Tateyamaria sp.]|uniref:hypothetical protein n=1 Tax=Tateyamaria sp. TaxID=1929288 RepID=UPI003B20F5E2
MTDAPDLLETTEVYFHVLARCEACEAAWCPVPGAEQDVWAAAHAHAAQTGHRVTLETRSFICHDGDPISVVRAGAPMSDARRADVRRLQKALRVTGQTYGEAIALIDRWDRGVEPEPTDPEVRI